MYQKTQDIFASVKMKLREDKTYILIGIRKIKEYDCVNET